MPGPSLLLRVLLLSHDTAMAVQQLPENSALPLPVYVSQSSFRQGN